MLAFTRWLMVSLCVLCLTLLPMQADAQSKARTESQTQPQAQPQTRAKTRTKARGARLKAAPTVTYADGQTVTQRQRSEEIRLRRECKGRPNAGACLGYTR